MKRCLILTGGSVDYPTASVFAERCHYELILAVDSGMEAAEKLHLVPHYCVGDFDSVSPGVYDRFRQLDEIIWETHPPEKDETDTELAICLAIRLGAEEIHIFGATGTRMDHTLACVGLLLIPLKNRVPCWLIDGHNRITLIDSPTILRKAEVFGTYLSLLPYTEQVTGVTLTGFKYPLQDYTFVQGNSLGISNEIQEEQACIQIKDGILILVESRD